MQTNIKAVQVGKTFMRQYVTSMLFLIIGTIIGATISYQTVKPTITQVADQCISALQKAYLKQKEK